MSRLHDLELENAMFKARLDRIRKRTNDVENACHAVGQEMKRMSRERWSKENVANLIWAIADSLEQIDSEHDRYYIEKE